MDKIKVYMITTWGIKCGIADYSSQLYSELNKLDGLNVEIVPIKNPDSLNPFYFINLLRKITDPDIVHIQYQRGMYGNIPFMGTIPVLKDIYTFIVLNSYFPLIIFILKLWKRCKILTTVHEFDIYSISEKIILKFLNLSDFFIFHENRTLKLFENEGIDKKKLLKIPLGLPKAEILDKDESKLKCGVSGKKILTIFGFLHENKGHDLVIDILPRLEDDVVLLIIGEARIKEHEQYYQFLTRKINELGLNDRVFFLGYVEDSKLPSVFSATDIFIFPYRYIHASSALNSVLGYKNPIVTSNVTYFREFKEEYDCIEIFDINNKDDLLKIINVILNNSEKRRYLEERCENVCVELNWGKIAEKTYNTYLKMIK